MVKFFTGFVLLFAVLALQVWLASAGVFVNLTYAALITFAFIFDFWELAAFVLLAVFLLNWQPGVSTEILIFALFPIAAHFLRSAVTWQSWVVVPIGIFLGFVVLYGTIAPQIFLAHPAQFLLDVVAGWLFGALLFLPLERWK